MVCCFRNRLFEFFEVFDTIGFRPVLPTSLTVYFLRPFVRKDLHSVVNVMEMESLRCCRRDLRWWDLWHNVLVVDNSPRLTGLIADEGGIELHVVV